MARNVIVAVRVCEGGRLSKCRLCVGVYEYETLVVAVDRILLQLASRLESEQTRQK